MMFDSSYYIFGFGLVGFISAIGWVVYFLSRKGEDDHKDTHVHQV